MAVEQIRPARDANYYLKEGSLTDPKFEGNGARIIGIEGTFSERAFLNLYAGYTTGENGQPETKLPRYMHPDRRGAFDLTVNMPKDVSVLNVVANDRRIDDVIHDAYQAVAKDVEKQALCRSNKRIGRRYHEPNNLVYTIFDHSSNRHGEPHRHGHIVFQNLTHHKGAWQAVEFGKLDQPRLTDIYNKTMRKGLHELGYKTEKDRASFRVVGFPWDVKTKFSQRHADIQKLESEYRAKIGKPMSSKARGKLSVYHRPKKPADRPLPERRASWLARMTDAEARGVHGVVEKAKRAFYGSRLKAGLKKHLGRLKETVRERTEVHEHGNGISR